MPKKKAKRITKSTGPKKKTTRSSSAPPIDPRAMEGFTQQFVPGMTVADSPVHAAQEIMYQAFEATSARRQVELARKAIEISPNCADAYVLLAEYAETLPEALDLYEQGVAAGERALGRKGFKEYDGHFWGFVETRPYMRARAGFANSLWLAGRREEAAEHCREMLRLNPNDNQGIRYRLASMLLGVGQHDELEQLLKTYEDDDSVEWAYTRALLAFRLGGDSSDARRALIAATEVNQHVPAYLARLKLMPRQTPDYITFGGEDEAICYAAQFLPAWKETPGAAAWLRSTLKLAPSEKPKTSQQPWSRLRLVLAQLPQRADEIWELELRAAPADGNIGSSWALVAYNATDDQVLHFEFLDARPKDAEVWSFVIALFRTPQDEEPRRPGAIRVGRKTWFRSWQRKLQEIGIECHLSEPSHQVDRWFESAAMQLEKVQRMANEPGPNEAQWSKLAALPQELGQAWQAVVRQLPVWIQIAGEPKRPWVCLVVDTQSEAILATEIETDKPTDDWIVKGVWQAIASPAAGEAHRPAIIQVESDRQQEMLSPVLEPLGIQCARKPVTAQLRYIIDEMAAQLGGQRQPKALIRSPGVTIEQVGGFFQAAADFYRARPWRETPGDSIIRVACERFDSGPWYAVVMGQSGIELGLALYEDLQLLRTLLAGQLSDEEYGRRTSAVSVTFGETFELAPEDLDAAEEHGWAVAGPEAYPCVLRVNPGMALRTPLKWELELLEGCLRAIPDFLGKTSGQAEIAVTVSCNTWALHLERQ